MVSSLFGVRHKKIVEMNNCVRHNLEPPYTEPYVLWCGGRMLIAFPNPNYIYFFINLRQFLHEKQLIQISTNYFYRKV